MGKRGLSTLRLHGRKCNTGYL